MHGDSPLLVVIGDIEGIPKVTPEATGKETYLIIFLHIFLKKQRYKLANTLENVIIYCVFVIILLPLSKIINYGSHIGSDRQQQGADHPG